VNKVKVVEVKAPPQMKNPAIQQGIRDKTAAESWGTKNGHAMVYYLSKKQRVYAERLKTRVDQVAERIEERSAQVVLFAESEVTE
jgi:hypothetical protein